MAKRTAKKAAKRAKRSSHGKSAPATKTRASKKASAAKEPPAAKKTKPSGGTRRKPTTEKTDDPRALIRIYRHGLGDCILVRIPRKNGPMFKLLIDCGVAVAQKKGAEKMQAVMRDILDVTKGSVDVLAVTHEHWDHVSGFQQAEELFEELAVGQVWVAWTEDPRDELAKKLRKERGQSLELISASVDALRAAGNETGADSVLALTGMFGAAGEKTKAAFGLAKAKSGGGGPIYLHPADPPIVPEGCNFQIFVLGPPHDEKAIKHFNPSKKNPETYELALDGSGVLPLGVISALSGDGDVVPFPPSSRIPLSTSQAHQFFRKAYWTGADWRRIDADWLGNTDEFALMLQSATNNTSLVLAIELEGGDVLLFAADAQVGNWLSWEALEWGAGADRRTGPGLLEHTIFYKVGHHGSYNATMKEKGLDLMTALKTAIIPVDEVVAKKMRWGAMPLASLVAALSDRTQARTLRTDKAPEGTIAGVEIEDLYFELTV
ncbi:beta-lactamase superfamily II metal-dependent hydrolase [Bradyrhizobium sp. USDA 4516]